MTDIEQERPGFTAKKHTIEGWASHGVDHRSDFPPAADDDDDEVGICSGEEGETWGCDCTWD